MTGYKSRQRWLAERWVAARRDQLKERFKALQIQILPAGWAERCQRMLGLQDTEVSAWQPRSGSSSAELGLLLKTVPLYQRRWLACLLDAPTAGVMTLVESVERLQLDWRSRVDPLHSHREYAGQLFLLARQLGLPAAAESAYLENERRIFAAIDQRLFESLPMRLRTVMINQYKPGSGSYLAWWQERLLARAGEPGYGLEGLGADDWPEMPTAWLALGWLCGLRLFGRVKTDG